MRVTTAIAETMTPEQVFEAIVDETASAVEASSVGLWVVDDDGRVRLVRSLGYTDATRALLAEMRVDSKPRLPTLDAILRNEPLWLSSRTELLELYPHLSHLVGTERSYNIACLPLQLHDRVFGALAFTFEDCPPIDAERKTFLTLVARRSSQALERLHLLETERSTRERVETLNAELQQIVRYNEMFTAILGHDLRNPLAAITTAAQLALNRKQPEKVSKPLTRILASSRRMARMIDQLLDFTRLRSGGGVPIEPSAMDISQVVGQVIMPKMGGNELYSRLQSDPRLSGVPVLVSTSNPSLVPRGIPAVKKPADLCELLCLVRSHGIGCAPRQDVSRPRDM